MIRLVGLLAYAVIITDATSKPLSSLLTSGVLLQAHSDQQPSLIEANEHSQRKQADRSESQRKYPKQYGYVHLTGQQEYNVIVVDEFDPTLKRASKQHPCGPVAYGSLLSTMATTGWGELTIMSSPGLCSHSPYSDDEQAYAAGYLEGVLTVPLIWEMHLVASQAVYDEAQEGVKKVVQKQQDFTIEQIHLFAARTTTNSPSSSSPPLSQEQQYWTAVRLIQAQLEGMVAGYNAAVLLYKGDKEPKPLTRFDFLILQADAEIEDIMLLADVSSSSASASSFVCEHCNTSQKKQRERRVSEKEEREKREERDERDEVVVDYQEALTLLNRHARCSALVVLGPNNEDLMVGHATWSRYNEMFRLYKHIQLDFRAPFLHNKGSSFSSYPGLLLSTDDFTLLSTNLLVTETSNNVLSPKALLSAYTSTTLFTWTRHLVANLLSTTALEWCKNFGLNNSGTYNNQWMVIDYNLFVPKQKLRAGTVYVLEQAPLVIVYADISDTLQTGTTPMAIVQAATSSSFSFSSSSSYIAAAPSILGSRFWSSFNVPYFKEVRDRLGFTVYEQKHGDMFSHKLNARARIFERDAPLITDLRSLQRIMTQNDYLHDPLQEGCPGLAIAARCDLIPIPLASFPSSSSSSSSASAWNKLRKLVSPFSTVISTAVIVFQPYWVEERFNRLPPLICDCDPHQQEVRTTTPTTTSTTAADAATLTSSPAVSSADVLSTTTDNLSPATTPTPPTTTTTSTTTNNNNNDNNNKVLDEPPSQSSFSLPTLTVSASPSVNITALSASAANNSVLDDDADVKTTTGLGGSSLRMHSLLDSSLATHRHHHQFQQQQHQQNTGKSKWQTKQLRRKQQQQHALAEWQQHTRSLLSSPSSFSSHTASSQNRNSHHILSEKHSSAAAHRSSTTQEAGATRKSRGGVRRRNRQEKEEKEGNETADGFSPNCGHISSSGAIDAKVVNFSSFKKKQAFAIASPSYSVQTGVPPFRWSEYRTRLKAAVQKYPSLIMHACKSKQRPKKMREDGEGREGTRHLLRADEMVDQNEDYNEEEAEEVLSPTEKRLCRYHTQDAMSMHSLISSATIEALSQSSRSSSSSSRSQKREGGKKVQKKKKGGDDDKENAVPVGMRDDFHFEWMLMAPDTTMNE